MLPSGDHRLADPFPDEALDAEHLLLRVLPALQAEAGRRWHEQLGPTIDGHRRHVAVERLVADLEVAPGPGSRQGDLLVICPEGERHVLPARMAAEVWRRRGWRVRLLGPSLPTVRLVAHLGERPAGGAPAPTAVVVSASTPAALPGAARVVVVAAAAGLPVLAGGAGFGTDDRRAALIGASGWAADAVVADGVLAAWRDGGAPAPTATAPLEPGLVELEAAAVHGALRRAAVEPSARGLLHHAAEVAAAWEVVADDGILHDAVAWLAAGLVARRQPVAGGVSALVAALRPWCPSAADRIGEIAGI
jgi:hypothetical protein